MICYEKERDPNSVRCPPLLPLILMQMGSATELLSSLMLGTTGAILGGAKRSPGLDVKIICSSGCKGHLPFKQGVETSLQVHPILLVKTYLTLCHLSFAS